MHYVFRALAAALVLTVSAAVADAGELKVTIANGRATVIAADVPLGQILAEWARVGQTKIVNGEKLAGPNLTLQIVDRPEREVLDILLRSAAGYMMAPREGELAGASQFDRIMILATSRPPVVSASSAPQMFNNRPAQPMPVPDHDDMEPMPPGMVPPPPPGAMVVPGPNQLPGPNNPNNPNANPNQPPTQLTAPRPGIIPGQPQQGAPNPYQPPPVVRPPGGGGEIDR